MGTSRPNISSPPFTLPSNNGEQKELDKQSNLELISFLESSLKIAGVLKAREESAKAESLKDLSASIAELQGKNESLEKELLAMRNKEAESEKKKKHCVRLESELSDMKKDCTSLREREKLAQEKIKVLMEQVQKEKEECANRRAQDEVNIALKHKYLEVEKIENDIKSNFLTICFCCSQLKEQFTSLKAEYSALKVFEEKTDKKCKLLEEAQLKLEKARNQRIAKYDFWRDKYSATETWILQFLENNSHFVEKVIRQKSTNGDKQNANFDCSKRRLSDVLNIYPIKKPKKKTLLCK